MMAGLIRSRSAASMTSSGLSSHLISRFHSSWRDQAVKRPPIRFLLDALHGRHVEVVHEPFLIRLIARFHVEINVRELVQEAEPEVVKAVMPQAQSHYRCAIRQ